MLKYDLIALYVHHDCVKKKKKIEEMVVWNRNENEMTSKRAKMKRKKKWKWKDPREGELRR